MPSMSGFHCAVAASCFWLAAADAGLATPPPVAPPEGELRKLAVSLAGTRYREGGRSRARGLDATGLTALIFQKAGLRLMADEAELARAGAPVDADDLEPWDLVVFRLPGGTGGVGVCLGGFDFVYVGEETGRVRSLRLDETPWKERLARGRRLLGAPVEPSRPAVRANATEPVESLSFEDVPALEEMNPEELPAIESPGALPTSGDEFAAVEAALVAGKSGLRSPSSKGQVGLASYYGSRDGFEGRHTSSGERMNPRAMTAAHRTYPFGTLLQVTNLSNGRWVIVRVNDRGPHRRGRIIDVSVAAARKLGFLGKGLTRVRVEVARRAR